MEEERRRVIMQQEMEEQQRREAVEMQLRMEEIWRAQETEGEDKDKDQETGAGPSVPKKRKMEDKVRFYLNYNGKEMEVNKKYFF